MTPKTKLIELKKKSSLPPEIFDFVAGELLKFSKEQLFTLSPTLALSSSQIIKLNKIESEFLSGTPLEYIFKKAWFCGYEFHVDENVLIPRPETELLIKEAEHFFDGIKNNELRIKNLRILDIGTGSGCIIISIYKILDSLFLLPNSILYASDISPVALKIAKQNAKNHKAKINFIQSNLFERITGKFDLICANLPYISPSDRDLDNLRDPKLALVADDDGFKLISDTINQLDEYLTKQGIAIFEIGYDQEDKIISKAKANKFSCIVKKDLNGYPRVAVLSRQ